MTYKESIDFLFNSLPMYQRIGAAAYKDNLDNTYALLNVLDNPQTRFKSIHVAGTNGKGSVSHNLASICMEAGLRTGLYTSPHLKDFRERIQINGEWISEDFVIDFVQSNRETINRIEPSFFEMTVAMAFLYFAQANVDIAVIEVGMGGRLDSTNVIQPLASVITNISYDHVRFLGDTLEKIAIEKAGIIKPKTPVIIGETQAETSDVFTRTASKLQSPLTFADQEFQISQWKIVSTSSKIGVEFAAAHNGQRIGTFFSPLMGEYQKQNFKTVLATCQILGEKISPEAITQGFVHCLNNTHLQGRWQILQNQPLCIADTGHNEAGIRSVCRQIEQTPHKRLHFVLGMVHDKDIEKILQLLPPQAIYYFCKADIPRGLDADTLAAIAKRFHLAGKVYSSVSSAFAAAKDSAQVDDLIFVGGSTFTVAEAI